MLRVFHELHLSHASLFQAVDRSLRHSEGISTAHQVILFVLSAEDGLTFSEIARRTGHSKSRLTGLANTLENLGLVIRSPDKVDGRISILRLSKMGKAVVLRTSGVAKQLNEEILAPFSTQERKIIATFLTHIQAISHRFDRTTDK